MYKQYKLVSNYSPQTHIKAQGVTTVLHRDVPLCTVSDIHHREHVVFTCLYINQQVANNLLEVQLLCSIILKA